MIEITDDKINAILQGKDGDVRKGTEGCAPCQVKAGVFEVIKFIEDGHDTRLGQIDRLSARAQIWKI